MSRKNYNVAPGELGEEEGDFSDKDEDKKVETELEQKIEKEANSFDNEEREGIPSEVDPEITTTDNERCSTTKDNSSFTVEIGEEQFQDNR